MPILTIGMFAPKQRHHAGSGSGAMSRSGRSRRRSGWGGRGRSSRSRGGIGVGGGRGGGGAIADYEDCEVVGLMGTTGEILDGFEDAFLDLFQRALGQAGKDLFKARDTEQHVVGIHGFCDAVTEKYARDTGLELEAD